MTYMNIETRNCLSSDTTQSVTVYQFLPTRPTLTTNNEQLLNC